MIAAAVGLSRYRTPLDAYLDVRHEAPEFEVNENMKRGTYLEDGIRRWSADRLSTTWDVPDMPIVHPGNAWFTYSPDGLEVGGKRLLEVKAPGKFAAEEWGEDGTDHVPLEYLLQGAWGLAITGRDEAVFAAPIGGELRIYRHVRDLELEGKLIAKATAFINEHVIPGIPPPAVYGDDATLRRMYPKNERVNMLEWETLNTLQQQTVRDFLHWHHLIGQATVERDSKAVLVQDLIKDASGITGLPPELGYSRIDWKTSKAAMNAGTWKKLAEALMAQMPAAEQKQLITNFTPAVGSRPFTPRKLTE